jgi:hypothetical protein
MDLPSGGGAPTHPPLFGEVEIILSIKVAAPRACSLLFLSLSLLREAEPNKITTEAK